MTWADNVNGIYEMGGALALAFNCWQTYKDKEIKGLNIFSMIFFTSWGYWNLYFYPSLNQWMSTWGAAALVFFNTIWLGQALYYTRNRRRGALQRFNKALAQFWTAAAGTEKMVKDFEEHFPGKCVICSYQRYGYANGMTDDPTPPAHDHCPEKSPWSPELQQQIRESQKLGRELKEQAKHVQDTTRSNPSV